MLELKVKKGKVRVVLRGLSYLIACLISAILYRIVYLVEADYFIEYVTNNVL